MEEVAVVHFSHAAAAESRLMARLMGKQEAGGRKQEMCGDSAALLHFHDDGPHEIVHFMKLQSKSRTLKQIRAL